MNQLNMIQRSADLCFMQVLTPTQRSHTQKAGTCQGDRSELPSATKAAGASKGTCDPKNDDMNCIPGMFIDNLAARFCRYYDQLCSDTGVAVPRSQDH